MDNSGQNRFLINCYSTDTFSGNSNIYVPPLLNSTLEII